MQPTKVLVHFYVWQLSLKQFIEQNCLKIMQHTDDLPTMNILLYSFMGNIYIYREIGQRHFGYFYGYLRMN